MNSWGKKGNLFDSINNIQGLIGLGITMLIMGIILYNFATNIATMSIFDSQIFASTKNLMLNYTGYMNWLVPILYIVNLGFSVFWAAKIESDIRFTFVGIIYSLIFSVSFWVLGKVWYSIAQAPQFASVISQAFIADFMFTHAIWFAMFYQVFVVIALYGGKVE